MTDTADGSGHAVVIGASMAGLLAARALAESFDRVTVVERDRLPPIGEGRKAVPQGRHVHLLLPAGCHALEDLLPGITDELEASGANPFGSGELWFEVAGHQVTREVDGEVDATSISASRPLVEGHVRRRVLEVPGIEVLEGRSVRGLTADRSRSRVTGVRVGAEDEGGEEILEADLVVAAGGRSPKLHAWLEDLGYPRPDEERLQIEVHYATRPLRLAPGALGNDKWVLIGARPGLPRNLVLSAIEGDRWLMTLAGYGPEHHPPSDEEGFMRFAEEMAPPEIKEAIAGAEPAGEIATHAFPANQRRRYEDLDGMPAGLIPAGDAISSFNPLYGQGMTVAALEAVELRSCLQEGGRDGLERRFLEAASTHVDHAWEMAVGSDLALPEVDGERPLRVRVLNAYMDRLLTVAERDPVVATAFQLVAGMLRPPTHLMRPGVALRVLRGPRFS